MIELDFKDLFDRIQKVSVPLKEVQRKTMEDFIREKIEKGEIKDKRIRFQDEDEYAFFMSLSKGLEMDLKDILSLADNN